ncbi:NSMA phosphodiesterase, partial [Polypterus senegalus]|nr:NSMA phosphodiesterase [Polypterus senegalus]
MAHLIQVSQIRGQQFIKREMRFPSAMKWGPGNRGGGTIMLWEGRLLFRGVRYLSQHCTPRYQMIADLLKEEDFDLILLQEVYSEKDYLFLKRALSHCNPHSHYFKSGVIGSGLALFSKHKLLDVFLYRYSVNGFPYKAFHGDWFAGKAVGMVVVNIGGMVAHVYITHLHAEYSRENDAYLPHRVAQTWELVQFLRLTSAAADLIILGGDLNMHPSDLGIRLLRGYTGLVDCYHATQNFQGCPDGATYIPQNPFTSKSELETFPNGIRIDYILFKGSATLAAKCDSFSTTMGCVPGQPFPYSDHEALSAMLLAQRQQKKQEEEEAMASSELLANLIDTMNEARTEVKVGLHHVEGMRHTAMRMGIMGLALLLLEMLIALVPWLAVSTEQGFPRATFYLLGSLSLVTLVLTGVLYIFYSTQVKALHSTEEQMRLAVLRLQEQVTSRGPHSR